MSALVFTPSDGITTTQLPAAGTLSLSDLLAVNQSGVDGKVTLAQIQALIGATATAYTTALSATTGVVNSPVTMTFSPNGPWPASLTITPTATTLVGTFSPSTIAPTAGSTAPISVTFTPNTVASGTLTSSSTPSLTNTTGPLAYSDSAAVATAYTTTESASSGLTGSAVTLTYTPNGVWPSSEVITPSASGLTGTFSPTTVSPTAGANTAATATYTPSAASAGSFSSTSSPALTNTTGTLNYTANPVASAYTLTGPSTANNGTPITISVAPASGAWPAGANNGSVTVAESAVAGTFGSMTGIVAGSTAPGTVIWTSTATGTAVFSATNTLSLTNPANLSVTVGAAAPAYPTLTTTNAVRQAIYDANVGVTSSGGNVTLVADQSSNSAGPLSATAGVSVGASVNGHPGILFTGTTKAANSGLYSNGAWVNNMKGTVTLVMVFKTGATLVDGQWVDFESSTQNSDNMSFYVSGNVLKISRNQSGYGSAVFNIATLAANTLYKVIVRMTSNTVIDVWVNGVLTSNTVPFQGTPSLSWSNFFIGQIPFGTYSLDKSEFLEFHGINIPLNAADIGDASSGYIKYLTDKWGS